MGMDIAPPGSAEAAAGFRLLSAEVSINVKLFMGEER